MTQSNDKSYRKLSFFAFIYASICYNFSSYFVCFISNLYKPDLCDQQSGMFRLFVTGSVNTRRTKRESTETFSKENSKDGQKLYWDLGDKGSSRLLRNSLQILSSVWLSILHVIFYISQHAYSKFEVVYTNNFVYIQFELVLKCWLSLRISLPLFHLIHFTIPVNNFITFPLEFSFDLIIFL